jgi:ABC-type Zn uptake system ZnuABC Zn-binding protein ZnuA
VGTRWRPISLGGLALAVTVLTGCTRESDRHRNPADEDGRIAVAATIFPIADVIRQIGGDRVRVTTLLGAGQSPHGFEPTPAQIEEIANSRLLVIVGLGLDDWARRSAMASGRHPPTILDLGAALVGTASRPAPQSTGPAAAVDGHDDDHDHGGTDPHIWLDPIEMIRVTAAIVQAMQEIDPAGGAGYAANGLRFDAALRDLDRLCRQRLAGLRCREFVTLHAAFGHFAARYGLKEISIRHADAEEGSPKQFERVVAFIKQNKVKFIFAEPQFPTDRLDAIAKQTGVGVDRLDPLGTSGVVGHDSYIALMKTNLNTLVQGMSQ